MMAKSQEEGSERRSKTCNCVCQRRTLRLPASAAADRASMLVLHCQICCIADLDKRLAARLLERMQYALAGQSGPSDGRSAGVLWRALSRSRVSR